MTARAQPQAPLAQNALALVSHLRGPSARLGPVLRASLRGDEPVPIEDNLSGLLESRRVAAAVVFQASYHRIGPWVQRSLAAQPALPKEVADELASLQRDTVTSHLRALGSLAKLSGPLDSLGCRWIVFKGPALSKLVYRKPELRPYSDLDVLVERTRLSDAVTTLEDVGFRLVDANWKLIAGVGAGQVHLEHDVGGPVDLHWHILFDQTLRQTFPVPIDELIERSRVAELNGAMIRTFDPVDTLLHLCIHAAQEGADRLLWLKDIEQVVRHYSGDWDELVTRARRWKVRIPVAVVLSRARTTVGAPIPADVLEALVPSRVWRVSSELIERCFPVSSSRGEGTPATLLARATRGDERSSVASFAGGLGTRLRRLVANRNWKRDESQWDPRSPASILYSSEGAYEDRAAFFEWVRNHRD